jgi:hypothetical protein
MGKLKVHIPTVPYFYTPASPGMRILKQELDAVDRSTGFQSACPEMLGSEVLAPRYSCSLHIVCMERMC